MIDRLLGGRSDAWPAFPDQHRWPVVLEYESLRLRPLTRRDEAAWRAVRLRNWAWLKPWDPTLPVGVGERPLSFRRLVAEFRRQGADGRGLPWVIDVVGPDGRSRIVGSLQVMQVTLGSARQAQLGYWLDQDLAGRGIVPFLVALAMDYCLQVLRLNRLEVCIRPENEASLRVAAKLGLREEGLRWAYLHIDGAWRDHRVFAVTAAEVTEPMINRVRRPDLTGLAAQAG